MMFLLLPSLVAADPQPLPAAAPPAKPATSPDKVICRSFPETGSLVRMTKVCKTKREWAIERAAPRATGPDANSCGQPTMIGGPC